jgi:hypothetical protein
MVLGGASSVFSSALPSAAVALTVSIQCGLWTLGLGAALASVRRRWALIFFVTMLATRVWRRGNPSARPVQAESLNMRNALFEQVARYLSLQIRRNPELGAEDRPALFCVHPHGVLALSGQALLSRSAAEELFQREQRPCGIAVRIVVTKVAHHVPVLREFSAWAKNVFSTRQDISAALKSGSALVVFPGGAEEAVAQVSEDRRATRQGKAAREIHTLNKVPALARIARCCGVPVVPIYVTGELEALDAVSLLPFQGAMKAFFKIFKFVPLLPIGRRIFGIIPTPMPRRVPMTLHVGRHLSIAESPSTPPGKSADRKFVEDYARELRALRGRALSAAREKSSELGGRTGYAQLFGGEDLARDAVPTPAL